MKRTVILSIIAIVVLIFLCGPYAGLAIPVLLLAYFYMKYHKEREESPDAERMDMLTTVDEVTAKYGEPDDVIVTNAVLANEVGGAILVYQQQGFMIAAGAKIPISDIESVAAKNMATPYTVAEYQVIITCRNKDYRYIRFNVGYDEDWASQVVADIEKYRAGYRLCIICLIRSRKPCRNEQAVSDGIPSVPPDREPSDCCHKRHRQQASIGRYLPDCGYRTPYC